MMESVDGLMALMAEVLTCPNQSLLQRGHFHVAYFSQLGPIRSWHGTAKHM